MYIDGRAYSPLPLIPQLRLFFSGIDSRIQFLEIETEMCNLLVDIYYSSTNYESQ